MKIDGKTYVLIYLTGWQVRMVEDFCHMTCRVWTVPVVNGTGGRYMTQDKGSGQTNVLRMARWRSLQNRGMLFVEWRAECRQVRGTVYSSSGGDVER